MAASKRKTKVVDLIGKNLGSSTKVDHVRWAFGGERWEYDFDGDA